MLSYKTSASLLSAVLFLFLIVCCVSRTVPETRFRDSLALQGTDRVIPLPDATHFTFAVVGDLHITGGNASRLRTILTLACGEDDAFAILLGDLADTGREEDVAAYRDAISDLGWSGRVFPVIGNHDIFGDGWKHYKKANGPSHYTFTAGNAKFIALDTADGSLSDLETQWLESKLENDRPTHLFLLSHYLPIIPGQRTYLKLANEVEAMNLMKLAMTRRVTGWLGAHYHSYILDKVAGVDYLVAGGGGGRRMKPVEKYFFVQVQVADAKVTYRRRDLD